MAHEEHQGQQQFQKRQKDAERRLHAAEELRRSGKKRRIRKALERLFKSPAAPKEPAILKPRCEFKGCPYPSQSVDKDAWGDISVCRQHRLFLRLESRSFVDPSIAIVMAQEIAKPRMSWWKDKVTRYDLEGLYHNKNAWHSDPIRVDPVTGTRTQMKCRERVAVAYFTKARLAKFNSRAIDWQEKLKMTPRPMKDDIEAVKDLRVGGSVRIPARWDDIVLSAKKMRIALRSYRATMFDRWSVKGGMDGFLTVTKVAGRDGATPYHQSEALKGYALRRAEQQLDAMMRVSGLTG